ncbi:glycerophosphodiester phosphodiesterase family protein [Trueperella bernardiae]|uniref:glycerophosphodiester phosphodiesterase family protein n=1 Tax=Trueperella bernardiae TaxID=59561 RepID=UPI0029492D8B|nr:glycerophosphodiester phosphodiesterase family protein [Trueperella bernardiae]MDV6238071.1 glycerophosphodiester phosphodiesterase family protein [Trueperella bernardiae]
MVHQRMWEIGEPVILAHRGGGDEHPENTIVAFEAMRDQGFRYVETDCHVTADGTAVIIHDPILDRLTDASGAVSSWTWKDLRHVRDHSGNPLVRLDDLLEEFPDLIFNLDAKNNATVPAMVAAIRRQNAAHRVSLASFSEVRLAWMRRRLPGVRSSMGTSAIARLVVAAKGPRALAYRLPGPERGVECVQVPELFKTIQVVDEKFIALAHARGLAVHVWTVNDADDMRRALELGVDGLITDRPTLARSVIDQMRGGAN